MDYKVFKKELESYRGLLSERRKLEEEIMTFEYLLENVRAIRYDRQPGSVNESVIEERKLYLIDRLEFKRERLAAVKERIRNIDNEISMLSTETQYICNLSKKGKSYEAIGERLGYSKVAVYLKVRKEVEKI